MTDTKVAEKFNIDEWLDNLDTPDEHSGGNIFTDEFVQIEVHPVVVVTPKKQTESEARRWVGFSLLTHGSDGAMEMAREHLAGLGEDAVINDKYALNTVWAPGIEIIKYPETYLDRDLTNWKNTDPRSELYYRKRTEYPVGGGEWTLDPNWVMVSNGVFERDEESGEDVSAFQRQFGKKLWAHIARKPDMTRDPNDDRTWNEYNTETYTDKDGEEKLTARRYDVIDAVFATQVELKAYMEENGFDRTNEPRDAEGAEVDLASIPVSEELADWLAENELDEVTWFDATTGEGLLVEVYEHLSNEGTGALQLNKARKVYDGLPMSVLKEIAPLVLPF